MRSLTTRSIDILRTLDNFARLVLSRYTYICQ